MCIRDRDKAGLASAFEDASAKASHAIGQHSSGSWIMTHVDCAHAHADG